MALLLRTSVLLVSVVGVSALVSPVPSLPKSLSGKGLIPAAPPQGLAKNVSSRRPAFGLRGGIMIPSPLVSTSRMRRALVAEILGTFIIVFLGTGVVAVSEFARANVGGLFGIAIVWGVAVAGAAHTFAKVSGSHFNPAISVALALKLKERATPLNEPASRWLALYMISQLLGAFLASLLVGFMFQGAFARLTAPLASSAMPPAMGCYPSAVYGLQRAIVSEVVGTALLALGALSFPSAWHLGPWLATLIIVFAPFSGASFNPARELGPRIVSALLGFKTSKVIYTALIPYMIAPVVGAVIGVTLALYIKET